MRTYRVFSIPVKIYVSNGNKKPLTEILKMTDTWAKTYYSLREAAAILPGRPHVSTLVRWRTRGVHGVKLATVKIGGRRMVESSALDEFLEAVTAAADGQPLPTRSAKQREKAILAAERELAREGIGQKRPR